MSIVKYNNSDIRFDVLSNSKLEEYTQFFNDIYAYNNLSKRCKTYEKIEIKSNTINKYNNAISLILGSYNSLLQRIKSFIRQNKLLLELLRIYNYDFDNYVIDLYRYNLSNSKEDSKRTSNIYFNSDNNYFSVIYILRRDITIKGFNLEYISYSRRECKMLSRNNKIIMTNDISHKITDGSGFGCMDFIVIKFKKKNN